MKTHLNKLYYFVAVCALIILDYSPSGYLNWIFHSRKEILKSPEHGLGINIGKNLNYP